MEQIKVIIGHVKPTTAKAAPSESLTPTCPSLTKKQRMWGFASCFCLGYLISFGSTFALIAGDGDGTRFGVTYSLGNIISLCASGFLVGPFQQFKLMMKPVRRIAAIIYIGMILVVLGVAIALPDFGGLVLLLAFIQFIAAVWYSASYIPYGRKIIKSVLKKVCNITSDAT